MTPKAQAERLAANATEHCSSVGCNCKTLTATEIESALHAAKAEGLREAADSWPHPVPVQTVTGEFINVPDWLRARADAEATREPCSECGNEERTSAGYLTCECPHPSTLANRRRIAADAEGAK